LIKLLNGYERFVHAADAYRLGGKQDAAALASLTSQHEQIKLEAGKVLEDLRNEKR